MPLDFTAKKYTSSSKLNSNKVCDKEHNKSVSTGRK